MTAPERVAAALRAERSLLVDALVEPPADDALARRAGAGPRAAAAPDDYALVVAAVREGYRLHYGEGVVVRPDDPDLALLGGDRLYALGLARLAELGDLDAVAELADLISLCAQAHARDGAAGAELADAAWAAAVRAIGHGPADEHEAAKARARAGADDAVAVLRAAAEADDVS